MNKEEDIFKWIDIDLIKPDQYQTVLTYGNPNNDGVGITICNHADGIFRFWESDKENKFTITHWCKLPKPPKDKIDDISEWYGTLQ